MQQIDVDAAVQRLDDIARGEYGTDYVAAINTPDDELTVRRMARLAGIELKHPFAKARPIQGSSETGAHQEWLFREELLTRDASGAVPLDGLKGNSSYDLALSIYTELQRQEDPETSGMDFGGFLQNSHSESNWFLAALRAAQPYLCEDKKGVVKIPQLAAKRKELWELAIAAAGDLAGEGLKRAMEPVCHSLMTLVPFLSFAPAAFTFGVSVVLVHFARRGFCKLQIQEEIITTLKWKSWEWEKK